MAMLTLRPESAQARLWQRLPRLLRFGLAGGLNTVLSYLVYWALLDVWGHRWAYGVAFVFGMALSYGLLRWAVFARRGRRHAWLWSATVQLGQLLLGLLVVELWVSVLRWPKPLAALAATAICVPLAFLAQRWVFGASRG